MGDKLFEQRINIKFLVKLEKNANCILQKVREQGADVKFLCPLKMRGMTLQTDILPSSNFSN